MPKVTPLLSIKSKYMSGTILLGAEISDISHDHLQ